MNRSLTLGLLAGALLSLGALGADVLAAPAPAPAGLLAPRRDDIVLGRRDAPVTLVAYLEYYHLYPRTVAPLLRRVRRDWPDAVRVLVRDYPMAYHAGAALTAEAAHGVFQLAGEEAFLRFAEGVVPYRGARDAAYLASAAAAAGAGPADRFQAQLTQGAWKGAVAAGLRDVEAARIAGSPQYFVDGAPFLGAQTEPVLEALGKAVAGGGAQRPGAPASAAAGPAAPLLRPGKGIGPFELGQGPGELDRLGLRHTAIDGSGWIRVAAEPGDTTTYQLRFAGGKLAIIEYGLSRARAGLRVGAEVLRRDRPDLEPALRRALGCGQAEHSEGGSRTPCASPAGAGKTELTGAMELDCSPWVTIGPGRACTPADAPRPSLSVRVSKD